MTEQEKFEETIRGKWSILRRFDKPNEYVALLAQTAWEGWQAAIASREPVKDIDMEALKRGQQNAVTAWAGVDFATFGSASREPMEWKPIETAPIEPFNKEHWYKAHSKTLLLGYANHSRIYMGSYNFTEKGKGRFLDHQGYVAKPTHWMPLPPPPKE